MSPFYHIMTFGCQMNNRDSETIAGMLREAGYTYTSNLEDSDVIILNTCCVRETAENKIWGKIGELKALKSNNPSLIIGICGCMTQQQEVAQKVRKRAPHVELIFGTHNIHELPEMINRIQAERQPILNVWDAEGNIVENLPAHREGQVKAFVTIMYGCNNFCTYCIVPYVRGRERSREIKDIVKEIEELVADGFKEVTLLGQNVNSYGKDLTPPTDFAGLLQELDNISGLERIRYMTSHPRDFNENLVRVIAQSPKVCQHFHLPVQSGSNEILTKMNRGYTREEYLKLVETIKTYIPGASITTDIIVGFPGETEDDFNDTMDLVRTVGFDSAFTFVYNKRSGTPAADMTEQVTDEIKRERIMKLVEVQNRISMEKNLLEVGQEHWVLVENVNKNNPNKVEGRSRTNKLVLIDGSSELAGKFVKVKITESGPWHLDGTVID